MEVLMATTNTKPEPKARTFGENIESDLASRFLRVVETAAIASARTMGKGDRRLADDVATQAMRRTMDNVPMRGTIVIGEGERDEAPMLYIGEKVGAEFPDGTGRGGAGGSRARPSAPREADLGHPRCRRPYKVDRRWRPLRRNCRRCDRNRRTRSDGIRGRPRRRHHGRSHPLPEWLHAWAV